MKKYNLLFASLLFLFPNETIAQERAIQHEGVEIAEFFKDTD